MRLRPAEVADLAACAVIFNAWVNATDWMPSLHSTASVERHYRNEVLPVCTFTVADRDGAVLGFLADDAEGDVDSLYLAAEARGEGIGRALLAAAKARHPGGLSLWTFQANAGARRFYAREGFKEVRRTDGDNSEGLPDILFAWSTAG